MDRIDPHTRTESPQLTPPCERTAEQDSDARPQARSGKEGASSHDAISFVGDVGEKLEGPREIATLGLPMILLAVVVGFCVGTIVWAALGISNLLVNLIWHDLRSIVDVPWFPVAVCTLGGLAIGLWAKATGTKLESLHEVMAQVKATGGYHVDSVPKSLVSFILPLAFGGSIGPEAGLTGIIAAACTWIGSTLKRAGLKAKAIADLTLSASLTAVFGTPFLGIVATAEDGIPNADDYQFRRKAKIVLYTAAAFGAFGGVTLVSSIPGMSCGLPRFDSMAVSTAEYAWFIPLAAAGWLLSLLFHAANKATGLLGKRLERHVVFAPVLCGLLIGTTAVFLPDVLFAGEEQSSELMGTWTTISAAVLLLTGVFKVAATPLCLHLGWNGGNFFPVIFAGISFGYGMAALTGIDPPFCVTVVTTALMAGVMRKPFVAIALLILCFPLDGVLWMGLAAVLSSAIPLPKALSPDVSRTPTKTADESDIGNEAEHEKASETIAHSSR